MLMPFQSVPKIHVWKENGLIFMMKNSSKEPNGLKHAKTNEKELKQKASLVQQMMGEEEGGTSRDKTFKVSKVTVGEESLICISEMEAVDENDNEVKISIRKVFADDKKKDKYYRYTLPRLITSATIRQMKAVLSVVKNDDDCIEETKWMNKLKEMFEELKTSPTKTNWSLQKSITFLHRFLCLVNETLDWMDDRKVASFFKAENKKEIEVEIEDFDCSELTGN